MDIPSDLDPLETTEWRDALDSVLAFEGPERAHFILSQLTEEARRRGAPVASICGVNLRAAWSPRRHIPAHPNPRRRWVPLAANAAEVEG